jgi:hypothetical protein
MAATVAEGVCDVCRSNKVDRIEDTCEVECSFFFLPAECVYFFTRTVATRSAVFKTHARYCPPVEWFFFYCPPRRVCFSY